MERLLIGLSFGSGLEGADAIGIRAISLGLELAPTADSAVRLTFPPAVRDAIRTATASSLAPDLSRELAETAVLAIRQTLTRGGVSPRDVFAIGFLEPSRPARELSVLWPEVADRIAEQTGLTVIHGFRHRDRAAGGAGHPITAIADYLLFRAQTQARLLLHLGAVSSLLLISPNSKISGIFGFEAGPCNQLFDALVYLGSRGKESADPGGKKAVQGRCLEPIMARWLDNPYLTRTPPKTVPADAFGHTFLLAAFDAARQLNAGLPDLLCTATHLAVRAIGDAVRRYLPAVPCARQVIVTGGGVRNGFLWQLVAQQFAEGMARSETVGVPSLARNAAAAGVLAALACDSVAANLPRLTGASGVRLLGQFVPGDERNWARVVTWVADQTGEYPRMTRAA
jgi:anhydro-N-acetylmuramic acid kinase